MNPQFLASSTDIFSPKYNIFPALALPIILGRSKDEQSSGTVPNSKNGIQKYAVSEANTRSQWARIAAANPTAGPFTTATSSFLHVANAYMNLNAGDWAAFVIDEGVS
mmetsp:Transcript_37191/g.58054  ORF Transcript_37191/g.58054 Transcript_37191/m.58054 type:complete len:108 (+) Transcript_37191:424-747(+)